MFFRDVLSQYWNNIHCILFPQLEQTVGELSSDHKNLAMALELVRIEDFLPCTKFNDGRPRKDRAALARAFIAKMIFKLPYTNQIIKLLKTDLKLKVICGWDSFKTIPSESKFSRAFAEFANSSLPAIVHHVLVSETYKNKMVGHVVKDSVPIEVREKHLRKVSAEDRRKLKCKRQYERRKTGELNRRQKQLAEVDVNKMILELPTRCDKGMKKSAQGYTEIWKGYKLHAAVDDRCIPLSVIITSASLNDCEVAIPLAIKAQQVVGNFYDLMDAAYDHPEIREHSISIGHIPVIDKCPKNKPEKIEKENEKNRKKLLNFKTADDKRYNERFSKERFNASLKDFYGGRNILYRGHSKVSCHLMFGVLALTAMSMIKLI